jgi:hypothetical protein
MIPRIVAIVSLGGSENRPLTHDLSLGGSETP